MSTPMFVREPKIGTVADGGNNPLEGAAFGASPSTGLVCEAVDEALLVEEVRWSIATNQIGGPIPTDAGTVALFLNDPTGGDASRRIALGYYSVPAASLLAGGVAVNVTLPPGRKLYAAHNVVKTADHSTFVSLDVVALGGIVR